ncbi:MAG: cysteine hydrolase family protein [Pacificibacter sp.]|uniref:cysteine hydrolase family protein n=1 Tax=Pacificibacter sp. TaxID=1917866 RepID=UPI00321B2DA2
MTKALILIDIQTGFDAPFWGARNNPDAETKAARLLAHFRAQSLPIFHVKHLSTEAGSPLAGAGAQIKPIVAPLPDEPVIAKSVNSAFIGTDLDARLRAKGVTDVIICGLTTPHCVSTTTRMAANLGYHVTLAHDACASFAINANTSWSQAPAMTPAQIHDTAVSHLHGEFATAESVDDILGTPIAP